MSPLIVILISASVGIVAMLLYVAIVDGPNIPKRTRAEEMAALDAIHSLPSGERVR